jgi:hypothetical protein
VSAQLNCQAHDAASISLSNVQGFSIQNCLMHGTVANGDRARNTGITTGGLVDLSVVNSTGVTVDLSDARGFVSAPECQGCTFSNSTFLYPGLSLPAFGPRRPY